MNLFPVILTFLTAYLFFSRQGLGKRESILASIVIGGLGVVLLTEILSAWHQLDRGGITVGWWLYALGTASALFFTSKKHSPAHTALSLPLMAKVFLGGGLLIVAVLFVETIGISPNSWDAMTYHLPRIEHWVQNKTIAYYPSYIIRQDSYTPFSEWVLLHLRILTATDSYSNILEFLSMLSSAIGVSLIARQLGAQLIGQSLSVLLVICLPMGMLQATSTQTDYVVTQWFVIFTYFLLRSLHTSNIIFTLLTALSLGLAFLTKGYAYFYAVPFVIYWMFSNRSKTWPRRFMGLAFMLSIALLLNIGYFYRNYCAFGHILWAREYLTNGVINIPVFIANVLRNAGLHLVTCWPSWNERVAGHMQSMASHLHFNLNPVEGTFGGMLFELVWPFHESYAGNFFYSFVLTAALITAAINSKSKTRMAWPYIGNIMAMFLLLCLLLRFQPFGSRFHLCIFVLSCAWTALIIEKLWPRPVIMAIGIAVWAACLPWLVFNYNKPLTGEKSVLRLSPMEQYFVSDPAWKDHMTRISNQLELLNCPDIGFIGDENSKEYFLWTVLRLHHSRPFRLEHVDVPNPTGKLSYPLGSFTPCAVVSMYTENPPMIVLSNGLYVRTSSFENQQSEAKHHSAIYLPLSSLHDMFKRPATYASIHDYIERLYDQQKINENPVFTVYSPDRLQESTVNISFTFSDSERQRLIAYVDELFNKDFKTYEHLSYQYHHGLIWESDYAVDPATARAFELRQILTSGSLEAVKKWPRRGPYNPYTGREGTDGSLKL